MLRCRSAVADVQRKSLMLSCAASLGSSTTQHHARTYASSSGNSSAPSSSSNVARIVFESARRSGILVPSGGGGMTMMPSSQTRGGPTLDDPDAERRQPVKSGGYQRSASHHQPSHQHHRGGGGLGSAGGGPPFIEFWRQSQLSKRPGGSLGNAIAALSSAVHQQPQQQLHSPPPSSRSRGITGAKAADKSAAVDTDADDDASLFRHTLKIPLLDISFTPSSSSSAGGNAAMMPTQRLQHLSNDATSSGSDSIMGKPRAPPIEFWRKIPSPTQTADSVLQQQQKGMSRPLSAAFPPSASSIKLDLGLALEKPRPARQPSPSKTVDAPSAAAHPRPVAETAVPTATKPFVAAPQAPVTSAPASSPTMPTTTTRTTPVSAVAGTTSPSAPLFSVGVEERPSLGDVTAASSSPNRTDASDQAAAEAMIFVRTAPPQQSAPQTTTAAKTTPSPTASVPLTTPSGGASTTSLGENLADLLSSAVVTPSSSSATAAAASSTAAAAAPASMSAWERLREQQIAAQAEEREREARERATKERQLLLKAAEEAWVASRPRQPLTMGLSSVSTTAAGNAAAALLSTTLTANINDLSWASNDAPTIDYPSTSPVISASDRAAAVDHVDVSAPPISGTSWDATLRAFSTHMTRTEMQLPSPIFFAHYAFHVTRQLLDARCPTSVLLRWTGFVEKWAKSVGATVGGGATARTAASQQQHTPGATGRKDYIGSGPMETAVAITRISVLTRLRVLDRVSAEVMALTADQICGLPGTVSLVALQRIARSDWARALLMLDEMRPLSADPFLKRETAVLSGVMNCRDYKARSYSVSKLEASIRNSLSDIGKRHSVMLMVAYGSCRRYQEVRRLYKELEDKGDVDETSAAAMLRYTPASSAPDLLKSLKEKGLNIRSPGIVEALMAHHWDRRNPQDAATVAREFLVDAHMLNQHGHLACLVAAVAVAADAVDLFNIVLQSRFSSLHALRRPVFRRTVITGLIKFSKFDELIALVENGDVGDIALLPPDLRSDITAVYRALDRKPSVKVATVLSSSSSSEQQADGSVGVPSTLADTDLVEIVRQASAAAKAAAAAASVRGQTTKTKAAAAGKRVASTTTKDTLGEAPAEGDAPSSSSASLLDQVSPTSSPSSFTSAMLPSTDRMLEYGKERNWVAALELLRTLPSSIPDQQQLAVCLLYNCALSAAVDEPAVVDHLLEEMRERRVPPNTTTYNTAMSAFARSSSSATSPQHEHRWQQAMELFGQMPPSKRDTSSYAVAMSLLAKRALWREATVAFNGLKSLPGSPRPPPVIYGLLIQASHKDSWHVALRSLQELQRQHGIEQVKELMVSRVVASLEAHQKAQLAAKLLDSVLSARKKK